MMIDVADVLALAVMTLILVLYIRYHFTEMARVTSRVDGRSYVVRKLPDRQAASDYLARINGKLQELIKHVLAKRGPKDAEAVRLYRNYRPEALSEGSPESGFTSYSVNKGEKLVLCIRQRDTNVFVDENVLMYVAIHELAHLMTKDVGHTQSFWDNFKGLLAEAISIGLYTKLDFDAKPEEYCGIHITSSAA